MYNSYDAMNIAMNSFHDKDKHAGLPPLVLETRNWILKGSLVAYVSGMPIKNLKYLIDEYEQLIKSYNFNGLNEDFTSIREFIEGENKSRF